METATHGTSLPTPPQQDVDDLLCGEACPIDFDRIVRTPATG